MAGHTDGGGGWSQADLRRPQMLTDQHGRKWFADIETRSGYPVGPIRNRFDAPWLPDQAALRMTRDEPTRITIDYDWMLSQRQEAHADYHQRAVEEAASRQWPVPALGEPYRRELQMIVGKPPRPIEPIVAAMQGNKWILGLTTVVDERLTPFIEMPNAAREEMLRSLPDFRDKDLDPYGDLEEEVDPDAIGGRRVNPSRKHRQKREDAA
jgi:hypothetical protein